MKIIKSFQYDDIENPKVHKWITDLLKAGKSFSESVRRLIENNGSVTDEIINEIDSIKKQIANLQKSGVNIKIEAARDEIKQSIMEQNESLIKIKSNFFKNRYFNDEVEP